MLFNNATIKLIENITSDGCIFANQIKQKMKSILKQAQNIFFLKEEFKSIFSKKTNTSKVVKKEEAKELKEELV